MVVVVVLISDSDHARSLETSFTYIMAAATPAEDSVSCFLGSSAQSPQASDRVCTHKPSAGRYHAQWNSVYSRRCIPKKTQNTDSAIYYPIWRSRCGEGKRGKTSRAELVCCPIWARSRIFVLGVIPAAIGFYFILFFSLSGSYFIFPGYVDGTHAGERTSDKVLIPPHLAWAKKTRTFSALAKTFLESLALFV